MTPRRYKITDEIGTGCVTVDCSEVAAALRPWYPEAPAEVFEQIAALEAALCRDEWTAADQYLGVRVERIDDER